MSEPFRPRRAGGRRPPGATFATTAAVALIVGVVLLVFILQLARSGTVQSQLGDKVFDAGRAADLARQLTTPAPDGRTGPILLQALVGNHDLYLQHLGDDANAGWLAFEAHAPGAARTCTLAWVAGRQQFLDPCDGRSYPADGAGLQHYQATVNSQHRVIVDLRVPAP